MTRSGYRQVKTNLDGLIAFSKASGEPAIGFTQVFRNGCIEDVDAVVLSPFEGNTRQIPSIEYEKAIIDSVTHFREFFGAAQIDPPYVVMLSLIGVKGYTMTTRRMALRRSENLGIDRDDVLIPEVIVEEETESIDKCLQPIFDTVWQACGLRGSVNYEADGTWNPPQ